MNTTTAAPKTTIDRARQLASTHLLAVRTGREASNQGMEAMGMRHLARVAERTGWTVEQLLGED